MRHLQLIAISGAIGSSIFLSVGGPMAGGPLALMIGVSIWASVIWVGMDRSLKEGTTDLPVRQQLRDRNVHIVACGRRIHSLCAPVPRPGGRILTWLSVGLQAVRAPADLTGNYFICQFTLVCNELTGAYLSDSRTRTSSDL